MVSPELLLAPRAGVHEHAEVVHEEGDEAAAAPEAEREQELILASVPPPKARVNLPNPP